MAKSNPIQVSPPAWLREKLREYGHDHHLENGSGELKDATTILHILKLYMRGFSREDIQSYANETGCCYDDIHTVGLDRVVSDKRR